jgi:hypothetical protein
MYKSSCVWRLFINIKESFVYLLIRRNLIIVHKDVQKENHNVHERSMPESLRRLAPTSNPYKCYQCLLVPLPGRLTIIFWQSLRVVRGIHTSCGTVHVCSASMWTRKRGHIQININCPKIPFNEIQRTDILPRQKKVSMVLRGKELEPAFLTYW